MSQATLNLYFARRFLSSIGLILGIAFVVVLLVDFVELVRRSLDAAGFTWPRAFFVSLLRVPVLLEQVLPFAVLFGSMAAFLALSRRLELVVVRASGVSVWQFAVPPLAVAFAVGVFATTVFNPTAARLKEISDDAGVRLFGTEQVRPDQRARGGAWLRQEGADGESIVYAEKSLQQGLKLVGVTVQTFKTDGSFHERIDAKEANLEDGRWRLTEAMVRSAGTSPQIFDNYYVSTRLSAEQVRESLAAPETVPFWQLPAYIAIAERSGLPAFRYRLQYQMLLSRPLLLVAMVLIAATVSLRVFRFGNIGRMILGGVVAGFVLYVVTQLARDLGGAGLIPPLVAAWSPAIVATLMGFTVLLYQEDG